MGVRCLVIVINYWIGTRQYGLCRTHCYHRVAALLMSSNCTVMCSIKIVFISLHNAKSYASWSSIDKAGIAEAKSSQTRQPLIGSKQMAGKTPLQLTDDELLLQYLLYKATTDYSLQQIWLCLYQTCCRSSNNAQQGVPALWCTPTPNPKSLGCFESFRANLLCTTLQPLDRFCACLEHLDR